MCNVFSSISYVTQHHKINILLTRFTYRNNITAYLSYDKFVISVDCSGIVFGKIKKGYISVSLKCN